MDVREKVGVGCRDVSMSGTHNMPSRDWGGIGG